MPDPDSALVFDCEENSLGVVVMRLLRLGIDVFYAKGRDEAWLLAQQEAKRIKAVLFAVDVEDGEIGPVLECLDSCAPDVARGLVAVGQRPDGTTRESLRARGVAWALWEPYDEGALRSVVSAAMNTQDISHTRKEPRLPTTLLGRAFVGVRRTDVVVSTLSTDGAFLEMPLPFLEGTQITLEVGLPGGSMMAKANVVHTRHTGEPGVPGQPVGMGVAFSKLDPGSEQRLNQFLADQVNRFAV